MRMSWRTPSLLIALFILLAAITVLVARLISTRSDGILEPAVRLMEPVTKDISAELGWQNTGILLEAGETIRLQFISGEIRDGDAIIRGPSGVGWACDDSSCCEPLPVEQRDALIGRVGDHLFLIGDQNTLKVQESGELQLRINDCDAGLFDNAGKLTIKISP